MAVKFTMKSTRELLKARGLMAGDTAQKFVDGEVLRRCFAGEPPAGEWTRGLAYRGIE